MVKVGDSVWICSRCRRKNLIHWAGNVTSSHELDLGIENQYDCEGWKKCRCGNEIHVHMEFFEYPEGEVSEEPQITILDETRGAKLNPSYIAVPSILLRK